MGIMFTNSDLIDLSQMETEDLLSIYELMSKDEQDEFERLLRAAPPTTLMPHQHVPLDQKWWEIFLLVGGRGTGKTVTGAFAAREHLRLFGKDARIGIGAPTVADARDTCMEGHTGLIRMFPNEFVKYNRSLG
jgi:phage terminase large subunit-like protein